MKIVCQVDAALPETIRINSERRALFRLSGYSDDIRDVRIVVRSSPENGTVTRFSCLVWVRLGLRDWIIVQGSSESANDAVSLAIDKAAALVVKYSRRRARTAGAKIVSATVDRVCRFADSTRPLSQTQLSHETAVPGHEPRSH